MGPMGSLSPYSHAHLYLELTAASGAWLSDCLAILKRRRGAFCF